MNPTPHEDQAYGSGRRLDHQAGRLSGDMKQEPIFPGPTTYEFWLIVVISLGVTLLLLTGLSLVLGWAGFKLLLAAVAIWLCAFVGGYGMTAFTNWRKRNYRYETPR